MVRLCFFFTLLIAFFLGCRQEQSRPDSEYQVKVRLAGDPGSINPMFSGSGATAREVYPYVFLQLAEYNPITLKLEPILAKSIPQVESIDEGLWAGGMKMDIEILEEAVWADGVSISGADYLFTVKAGKNPLVNAGSWRAALQDVVDIQIDPENDKAFTVVLKDEYLLGLELVMSMEILPAHIYDPEGIISKYGMSDLIEEESLEDLVGKDSVLQNFATRFNSFDYNIEKCSGAGPYNLVDWDPNQYILLSKKEDWWGDRFPDRPFLSAYPNELLFHIIPDETSAITQLKAGGVDVMSITNAENFKNLLQNETTAGQFSFHTPQLTRFYFIGLNNRHFALKDREVRRALAHLFDIDDVIENIEGGDAQRVTGTIPRYSDAYNTNLEPIDFDADKARTLLANAGWSDTDGNGILDKEVDGKREEMRLRIFVSQSELGKRISLLLQESAKSAGVEIEIVQKEYRSYYRDNILKGDFELAALSLTQSLAPYDPYARWHSDNAVLGGSNLAGYSSQRADEAIEKILDSANGNESLPHYMELQRIMYEEQPVVFLYSPVSRIVVNNRFNPIISVKRPGYFVNLFELAEN